MKTAHVYPYQFENRQKIAELCRSVQRSEPETANALQSAKSCQNTHAQCSKLEFLNRVLLGLHDLLVQKWVLEWFFLIKGLIVFLVLLAGNLSPKHDFS